MATETEAAVPLKLNENSIAIVSYKSLILFGISFERDSDMKLREIF